MSDTKRVSVAGPISKNPPSEFSINDLAEWLARKNPEFDYCTDKRHFQRMIVDAIDTGDLTYRGTPKFPLAGRCIDCHRKYSAPQTIPTPDIEQWCSKKGLIFCDSGRGQEQGEHECPEKKATPVTRKAFLSIAKAEYQVINTVLLPSVDTKKLPKPLQDKIKSTGRVTPTGFGQYLTEHWGASKSADDLLLEAVGADDE